MKKLMIALGAVAMAAGVQAAQVDWGYSSKDETMENCTVYLIQGAVAADSWASAEAVATAAMSDGGSGKIEKNGRNYTVSTTVAKPFGEVGDDDFGTKGYFVIVNAAGDKWSSTDVIDFATAGEGGTTLIYDPDAQQSSPGKLLLENYATTPSHDFSAVPEPTSGLLLLLGVAGLALRRRRA